MPNVLGWPSRTSRQNGGKFAWYALPVSSSVESIQKRNDFAVRQRPLVYFLKKIRQLRNNVAVCQRTACNSPTISNWHSQMPQTFRTVLCIALASIV